MKSLFLILLWVFSNNLNATIHWQTMLKPYFQNNAQKGLEAFQQGQYKKAAALFDDPYQQGVAFYKAKNYAAAITQFSKKQRPEIKTHALYNLGNSYLQMQQYEQAIDAYKAALKSDPQNKDIQYNLAIGLAMLAEIDPEKARKKKEKEEKKKKEKEKESDKKGKKGGEGEQQKEQQSKGGGQDQTKTPPLNENNGDFNINPDPESERTKPFEALEQSDTTVKVHINLQKAAKINKAVVQWLEQIEGNPILLLQNMFHIEEQKLKKRGINHESRPW